MFREAEPHDLLVEAYRHRNDAVLARQKLASAPSNESKTARWIGVSVNPADETLRAHLKLAEGVGLVVSDVIKDAPAAKAGLLKNDVLIAIKNHQLGTPEDLVKAVAESQRG